jgi:carboxypeptidase Taq
VSKDSLLAARGALLHEKAMQAAAYQVLVDRQRRLAHLGHVEAIASWDEAAMMPPGGGQARAEALASLRVITHQMATDPALEELQGQADAEQAAGQLDQWQAANLREMKRAYRRETAVPVALVEACSLAESRCEQAWRIKRAANDWVGLRPLLTEVVARKREVAAALAAKLGLSPYDALLDGFEPGARQATIDPLFADLRAFLPGFIAAAVERQRSRPAIIPRGPFPVERQRWLGLQVAERVGFDFNRGRLDVSHHPFCGGVPQDVRITTRYDEGDFAKSFMAVLHETGHAKYEQSLPGPWLSQPVGRARSMAVHESQSLFQEMQVSRSREFLEFAAPLMRLAFPEAVARQPEAFTVENLAGLYTRVQPDFIRTEADEATYPCHVLIRYDIEKQLIAGTLTVDQLPEAWDQGMRELLHLSSGDDHQNGCLQDVHWPAGLFGYFPTYTLGAVLAAQLFAAARDALGGAQLSAQIRAGDFAALNAWLAANVWGQGSLLETQELVRVATGRPIGTDAFKLHLQLRYT